MQIGYFMTDLVHILFFVLNIELEIFWKGLLVIRFDSR